MTKHERKVRFKSLITDMLNEGHTRGDNLIAITEVSLELVEEISFIKSSIE
jgi:hypothetical protein